MSSTFLTLREIPTLTQLYRARALSPSQQLSAKQAPSQALNDMLSHIQEDITSLQVDCIVNAANTSLLGGGGVDGAIHRAAGSRLLDECLALSGCETGDAKITNGYNLPATKVIHTVGPIYHRNDDHSHSETLLRSCYRRSLELAVENGLRSIAFSAISTGVYGYPNADAAQAVLDEVGMFLRTNDNASLFERVIFCSFVTSDVRAYERYLPVYFPPTAEDTEDASQSHDAQTKDVLDAEFIEVKHDNHEDDDDEFDSISGDEQEWEELSKSEHRLDHQESSDGEPVELSSQTASVTDIQSMQSSAVEFDELARSGSKLGRDH